MLLWTALIGWRRFLQGVLVRYGGARFVTWGTGIRLLSILTVGLALLWWNHLPGAVVGALMRKLPIWERTPRGACPSAKRFPEKTCPPQYTGMLGSTSCA